MTTNKAGGTPCQCPNPGFCERHGVRKGPHWHAKCQKSWAYWHAWEARCGPGQRIPPPDVERSQPVELPGGPGSELRAIFACLGYVATPVCPCLGIALQMDRWGPDGCLQNLTWIVDQIVAECARRKITARRLWISGLVRLAILRARWRKWVD